MQQSAMADLALIFLLVDVPGWVPVRARSCLMAFVLGETWSGRGTEETGERHKLECIRSGLPFSVYLDLYLHAFIDVFGPTLVVHPKLENIAILELEWSRLCVCGRQTNMVEESA